MFLSKQTYSTGVQTITGTTPVTSKIQTSNITFVCQQIAISESENTSLYNLFFDITLGYSRDIYTDRPMSVFPYWNTSIYTSNRDAYTRANGRPLFIVKGGETIFTNFYNISADNMKASVAYIGYNIDASGRPVVDLPNIPAAIVSKL